MRLAVGLGLLLFLLIALALTFLHTPAGGTAARVFLEQWGSGAIGGPLRLGQLELHLWKGSATATAASLTLEGVTLEAQRIDVAWSPRRGPHVHLLRPKIVVRDTGRPVAPKPPATGLAARPWQALSKLAGAEVEDGRLELRDVKGAAWLVLGDVDAQVVDDSGRRRVSVRIADAVVGGRDGGPRVEPQPTDATLVVEDGQLVDRAGAGWWPGRRRSTCVGASIGSRRSRRRRRWGSRSTARSSRRWPPAPGSSAGSGPTRPWT